MNKVDVISTGSLAYHILSFGNQMVSHYPESIRDVNNVATFKRQCKYVSMCVEMCVYSDICTSQQVIR